MDRHNEYFTPAQVDEQIDQLFHHAPATSDAALIDELQQLYQDDEHSLEKVWQRLGLQDNFSAYPEQPSAVLPAIYTQKQQPASANVADLGRNRHMSQSEKTPIMRKLSLAAAFLVAAVIVGSMFFVFTLTHHTTLSTSTASSGAAHLQPTQAPASLPAGIYLSNKTSVFRVDTQTQEVLWQQSVKSVGTIIPSGNVVYVIQNADYSAGAAMALDANTGEVLWTHSFTAGFPTDMLLSHNLLYASIEVVTPGTPVGGKKEVGGSAVGKIYLLNPKDGSEQGVYSNLDSAWSLVVGDGILGVSAGTGLQVLDLATMKPLWKATIASPTNEPVFRMKIVNGVLYALVSTNNDTAGEGISYLVAYKDTTGQQTWRSPDFPGDAILRFTVDQNIVYFGTSTYSTGDSPFKGTMHAFDTQSNKQLWSQSVDGAAQNTPFVSNGVVYIEADRGSNDQAHVAAIDTTTGTIKWQKALHNNFGDGFNVINGTVYSGNPSAGVSSSTPDSTVALNAADGTQLWTNTQFGSAQAIVPTA